MKARVLEARRLLLGDDKLEVWLEECEDGKWNIRFGRGTAERLHLSTAVSVGEPQKGAPPAVSLGELLYKAELFDHMVGHLQDQLARLDGTDDGAPDRSTDRLAAFAKAGVCTEGLSNDALEAMAHEFASEDFTDATLEEIAAWARDILAIRRGHVEPAVPAPDLLRF